MLTNDCFQPKINNLRVILNCFYIYLISNSFQYTKQIFFQHPLSIFKIYTSIRSVISTFCIFFYSILIIYALWSERVGILSISIILLIIFLIIRFVFDICGYIIGYFQYSLYPPFELLTKNLTEKTIPNQKKITEELTDFSIELILNIIGIILTIFLIIGMIRNKWKRRQMNFETIRLDIIRRETL